MSTIKQLSNSILTEKETKIIPENIKKDIQIFDITGTYEGSGGGGSGDVKLFETIQEMQSDPNITEGDKAVVYKQVMDSWTEQTSSSVVMFPAQVVLSQALSGSSYAYLSGYGDSSYVDISLQVNPSQFRAQINASSGEYPTITYTSSDGITYTNSEGDTILEFPVEVHSEYEWNDIIGDFVKTGSYEYGGFFQAVTETTQDKTNLVKQVDLTKFDTQGTSPLQYIDVDIKASAIKTILNKTSFFTDDYTQADIIKSGTRYYIYPYYGDASYTYLVYSTTNQTLRLAIVKGNHYNYTKSPAVMFIYDSSTDTVTNKTENDYTTSMGQWSDYPLYYVGDIAKAADTWKIKYKKSGDVLGAAGILTCSAANPSRTNTNWLWPETYYKIITSLYYAGAPTQFTLDSADKLLKGEKALGKNGAVTGTLGDADNSYKDANADVLVDVLTTYESFEPIIITNNSTDKAKLRSLHVLPSKQDGTALVNISALNLSSLFSSDYNLKAAYNIDVSNSPNLAYMFQSAQNLKYVSFKNSEKINYLGGTFGGTGLIRGPEMNTINVTTFSSTFSSCGNLESVPNYNTSNAVYMGGTFSYCRKLKSVPNFNTINVTTMYQMFSQCDSLESVPNFDTRNLTNINEIFSGCLNLQTVPNLNLSKVTTMQTAFSGCVNLQTIPNFDTSNVVNMQLAFRGCESLNNIPNLNISKANWVGELFYNCKSLIEVPNFNTTKVESCGRMFDGCLNLVSVPSFNMSSRCNNAVMMFANCPNLSNESLNNIMYMCTKMTGLYSGNKNFSYIGITRDQANICKNLSNYSAYKSAGWSDYN